MSLDDARVLLLVVLDQDNLFPVIRAHARRGPALVLADEHARLSSARRRARTRAPAKKEVASTPHEARQKDAQDVRPRAELELREGGKTRRHVADDAAARAHQVCVASSHTSRQRGGRTSGLGRANPLPGTARTRRATRGGRRAYGCSKSPYVERSADAQWVTPRTRPCEHPKLSAFVSGRRHCSSRSRGVRVGAAKLERAASARRARERPGIEPGTAHVHHLAHRAHHLYAPGNLELLHAPWSASNARWRAASSSTSEKP